MRTKRALTLIARYLGVGCLLLFFNIKQAGGQQRYICIVVIKLAPFGADCVDVGRAR
jgi:hypothetical protein